jgi:hypothetical protein
MVLANTLTSWLMDGRSFLRGAPPFNRPTGVAQQLDRYYLSGKADGQQRRPEDKPLTAQNEAPMLNRKTPPVTLT